MAEEAVITSPWETVVLDGVEITRPSLMREYTLIALNDVTEQPNANLIPDPNATNVQVVCEQPVLDAIGADPNYTVQEAGTRVAGGPENPELDVIPEAGDFQDWRTELGNSREPITDEIIWSVPQLSAAVGNNVGGRTWREIYQDLNDYCAAATP